MVYQSKYIREVFYLAVIIFRVQVEHAVYFAEHNLKFIERNEATSRGVAGCLYARYACAYLKKSRVK